MVTMACRTHMAACLRNDTCCMCMGDGVGKEGWGGRDLMGIRTNDTYTRHVQCLWMSEAMQLGSPLMLLMGNLPP